jgi:hypothetical protein
MSWDIFVQDIPPGLHMAADMPDDFVPKTLGPRRAIIETICSVVPSAHFSEPAWGRIDGPGFSIEVNLGEKEDVDGFAFHVRGGDMAAFVVADILQQLGFRAFDTGSDSGLFSIGPEGSEGQKKWRAYRDKVLRTK